MHACGVCSDRNGVDPIEVVEVDPHFNFHFSNAYEDADGTIVLGTDKYPRLWFSLYLIINSFSFDSKK